MTGGDGVPPLPERARVVNIGLSVFADAVDVLGQLLGGEFDELRCDVEFAHATEDVELTDLVIADGHVAALRRLFDAPGSLTANLGTGRGYSVLAAAAASAKASGRPVPHVIAPRRAGDGAACYADPSLAQEALGWQARHDLARMCEDSWRWQSMNPNGFVNA